jgi:hypothetical protein
VGIMGTGVDVIYPKENTRLAEQMVALGGRHRLRISIKHVPGAPEFPHPKPDYQRNLLRGTGG